MTANPPTVALDTSVVSIIYADNDLAPYYRERIRGEHAAISFQTLEELRFGAIKNGWGQGRMNELESHIDQYEVVWPSPDLVEACAALRAERERAGRRLDTADAWIAATAIMLECPLATHDNDFDGIPNLEIIKRPTARASNRIV